ncbi:hypothetical protein Agub_g2963, partial [Astrephomene gubernaculifera]
MARPLEHNASRRDASGAKRGLPLPRIDGTSLISLLLVFAAAAALPPRARLTLLGSELLFAASSALRYRRHNAGTAPPTAGATSASSDPRALPRRRAASSTPRSKRQPLPFPFPFHQLLQRRPHPHHLQPPQSCSQQAPQRHASTCHVEGGGGGVRRTQRFALLWIPHWRWRLPLEATAAPDDACTTGTDAKHVEQVIRTSVSSVAVGDDPGVSQPQPLPPQAEQQPLLQGPRQRRSFWGRGKGRAVTVGFIGSCTAAGTGDVVAWGGGDAAAAGGGGEMGRSPEEDTVHGCMQQQLSELRTDLDLQSDVAARAELLLDKLLDPREGHLPLLRGGHLLSQWFSGLAGPHQLHLTHLQLLLQHLLLPPATATLEAASAANAMTTAAGTQRYQLRQQQSTNAVQVGVGSGGGYGEIHVAAATPYNGSGGSGAVPGNPHDRGVASPSSCHGASSTPSPVLIAAPGDPALTHGAHHDSEAHRYLQALATRLMERLELPAAAAAEAAAAAVPATGAGSIGGGMSCTAEGGGCGAVAAAAAAAAAAGGGGSGVTHEPTADGSISTAGGAAEATLTPASGAAPHSPSTPQPTGAAYSPLHTPLLPTTNLPSCSTPPSPAYASSAPAPASISPPIAAFVGHPFASSPPSATPSTLSPAAPATPLPVTPPPATSTTPLLTASTTPLLTSSTTPSPAASTTPSPAAAPVTLLSASSGPLPASYRPLTFYLLTEAVAGATHIALRLMGFRLAGVTPSGAAAVYEWSPPQAG